MLLLQKDYYNMPSTKLCVAILFLHGAKEVEGGGVWKEIKGMDIVSIM